MQICKVDNLKYIQIGRVLAHVNVSRCKDKTPTIHKYKDQRSDPCTANEKDNPMQNRFEQIKQL